MSNATSGFSQDLVQGIGGFGTVFKGLVNGSFVAIKKLSEVHFRMWPMADNTFLFVQEGAIALVGNKDLPAPFTLKGQLHAEMKAL